MNVSARWAELMGQPEGDLPLDEAALLISARANPMLDVGAQLHRLDAIAARVEGSSLEALCRVLFDELGLRGDRECYDDPLNSYIDRVLDRHRGIPISLSVLLIEVGRRCGLELEPVGMPGHFLVRERAVPDRLIDAFDEGRRLRDADCERLFRSVTGRTARLTPDMLNTTGRFDVVARMLANLDGSFARRRDYESLGWVSDLRLRIPTTSTADRLHLAGRLAQLGQFNSAAGLLEQAADSAQGASQREELLRNASALRARLN